MRLRLGLLNGDLAERFGVSPTLCSYIYYMDQTFKKSLGKSVGRIASERIHKRTST